MQKHFVQIHETQSWRVDAHKLTLIICHNRISENENKAVEIYTNELWPLSPLIICQYLCLHIKTVCWWFHIKTPFYFFRYARVQYVKSLVTNIQQQYNMFRISPLSKKHTKFTGKQLENSLDLFLHGHKHIRRF